jgi:hypothetical protein
VTYHNPQRSRKLHYTDTPPVVRVEAEVVVVEIAAVVTGVAVVVAAVVAPVGAVAK